MINFILLENFCDIVFFLNLLFFKYLGKDFDFEIM